MVAFYCDGVQQSEIDNMSYADMAYWYKCSRIKQGAYKKAAEALSGGS